MSQSSSSSKKMLDSLNEINLVASYTFSEAASVDKRDKSSKKVSKGKSKGKLRLLRERRLLQKKKVLWLLQLIYSSCECIERKGNPLSKVSQLILRGRTN